MTRVDQRPVAFGLSGADGNQLQRRVLQSLERQWLDTWGAANASQHGDGGSGRGSASADARASLSDSVSTPMRPGPGSDTPSTPQERPSAGPASAHGHSSARRDDAGRRVPVIEPWTTGHSLDSTARPQSIDVPEADGRPRRASPASQADFEQASPRVDPSSVSTAPPEATTEVAATAVAMISETLGADEATESPRPPPRASSTAEDLRGTQRFMLRELETNVVQATLRDAQLDMAASQLAAQGLARALMEAGYAQVKVFVNGQQHRSEHGSPGDIAPSSGAAASAFTAGFTDVFTDAAPKDPVHGN